MQVNNLGIDGFTQDATNLIDALRASDKVVSVSGPFPYPEDDRLCQLHVNTPMSEDELENFLFANKDVPDFQGVFTRT